MKIFLPFIFILNTAFASERPTGTNQFDSNIWGASRLENINSYEENLGALWTFLQGGKYFAYAAVLLILAVSVAFALHFLIVGPKHFSHDGKKVKAFGVLERVSHACAAISWIVLVPTGIIMMWGDFFGGGAFVRCCKNMHGLATILFAISITPMIVMWLWHMLPRFYDIKWMLIVGGYLSKKKRAIPAGKFNAGQKAWYWVAIPGGLVMIITGAAMYFLDFQTINVAGWFGIPQIKLLRISAIVHNALGVVCAVFFLVHIYMAAIAIKGAIWSMITGYKEEEEVYVLHHYWYQELLKKNKIEKSKYEKVYPRL